MKLSAELEERLDQIQCAAAGFGHREFTAQHLLLALVQDTSAHMLLLACGADGDQLTQRLVDGLDRIPSAGHTAPRPDAECQRALAHAMMNIAANAGRDEATGADVLVAMLSGPRTQAVQWLNDAGLTWTRAVAALDAAVQMAVAAVRAAGAGEAASEVPALTASPQVLEQEAQRLRAALKEDREAALSDCTVAVSRWGAHLTEVGAESALEVTSEALALSLELEQRGDEDAARIVAGCAINRGNCLLQLRRYPEALADAQQAAARFRSLAEGGDVDGYRGLATALSLLSSAHREAGAVGAARNAAMASTRAGRRYLELEPGGQASWVLAACLTNEGTAHTEAHDPDGAIASLGEATALFERMPRDVAGIALSKWVQGLSRLANACGAAGRRGEALAHARRAAELAAGLPDETPGMVRIHNGALNDLAMRLLEAGENAEAVAVARHVLERARALADRHAHLRLDEAQAASNLGLWLEKTGDVGAALAHCEEAVALVERATAALDADMRSVGAMLVGNLAQMLGRLGRYAESLEVHERVLRMARALADQDVEAHAPFLLKQLLCTAVASMRGGRHESALQLLEQAHLLAKRLVHENARAHGPLLAETLGTLSSALGHLGRQEEALTHARGATAMLRELATGHRKAFLHSLAVSLSNLGVAESRAGSPQDGLQATLDCVQALEELEAEGTRDDTLMLTCLHNLGGRWFEVGDTERGRQALRECGRRLLCTLPTDPVRWTGLAGTVCSHLDDPDDLRTWHLPLLQSLAELRELAHDGEIADAFVQLQAHAAACVWDRLVGLHAVEHSELVEAACDVLVGALHSPDLARWLQARGGAGLDELAAHQQAVLAADQALQALLNSGVTPAAAEAGHGARVSMLEGSVRKARTQFRACRERLIAADPSLRGAFGAPRGGLRALAAHAGAGAALFLLQIEGDDNGPPRAVGVWVPGPVGPLQLISFPGLHNACLQAARRPPLGGTLRRLRDAEAEPSAGSAGTATLDDLAQALQAAFWTRLPGDDGVPLHVCCHGDLQHLPLALCDPAGRARQWPGLPFLRLSAAQDAQPPAASSPVATWIVDHDCAWETQQPLPMVALEAALTRDLLVTHGRAVASFAAALDRTAPWAGLVACCHGRRRDAHFESALQFAQEPLEVRSLMGRRIVEHLALLPACHAGETREDAAGNGLGIAAAFLLGGTRVVVASSKAVPDDLMPWFTTLVLWHTLQGLPAHEAATRARAQFAALDFPPAFRDWLQAALPSALATLQPGGAEHRGDARSLALLDDIADTWPWAGETLELFSSDAARRAEATRSVAAGVLVPRGDETRRLRLQADAQETAAFVMVYGVA